MKIFFYLLLVFGQLLTAFNTQINIKNDSANESVQYEDSMENSIDKILVLSENVIKAMNSAVYPSRTTLNNEYDFIIIGAGPAGCVLANRLSANPNFTVLLIEAGEAENPLMTNIPMASPNLQSTNYNWGYATEVQENACLSMRNQRCNWPHGRGLGGSSIINYMIYTRGNRRDFDRWENAGNSGWSYNDLLPYFHKFEKYLVKSVQSKNSNEDKDTDEFNDGSLTVEDPPFRTKIAEAFVESAKLANYSEINYNSGDQMGVSYLHATTKNGWRQTAATAFLSPIKNRSNLHISTKSWATKLIIDRSDNEVKAVKFYRNKETFIIKARKEVILAAGAFESPKLLMLSGIGPKEHLNELKIDVIKDLPVGKTLYEHMAVFGPIFTLDNLTDSLTSIDDVIQLRPIIELLAGKGPLTSNGIESLLYMKTNNSLSSDQNYPDIELLQSLATIGFDKAQGTRHGVRLSDEAYDKVFKPLQNQRAFQILPMLLHPRSKGYLKLKSQNPFHHPLFYPNFFNDTQDIDSLLEGIRESIRIVKQTPFQQLGAKLYNVTVPGCEHTIFNSDEYWRCYIKHLSATLHHQVSTCKMGPSSDQTTVVDSNLRVHGISHLRIADVSIIPEAPSGHTAAFSFLIGEKAANLIQTTWNTQSNEEKTSLRSKRTPDFDWQFKSNHKTLIAPSSTERARDKPKHINPSDATKLFDLDQMKPVENINPILNVTVLAKATQEFRNQTIGDIGIILWGSPMKPKATTLTTKITETTKNIRISAEVTTINNEMVNSMLTSETKSGMEKLMATMPTIDEDMIRTYTLNTTDRYGHGRYKAKYITKELEKMNFTQLDEDRLDFSTTLSPINYSTETSTSSQAENRTKTV